MESFHGVREVKTSDEITELCDVLAEIEKQRRALMKILERIVDKREAAMARRMINGACADLLQLSMG